MASEYDLTSTLIKHLDPHQVLPLLEFLGENKLYKAADLQRAKLQIVATTKMVDYFTMEEYTQMGQTSSEVDERKTKVLSELEQTQLACGAFVEVLDKLVEEGDEDNEEKLDAAQIIKELGVTEENIEALYAYAKLNFDCGRYQLAASTLKYYRQLSNNEEQKFWALWGKLAAETQMTWKNANSKVAHEDLNELRAQIDKREADKLIETTHLERLQQRTWLIHWSLFIFCKLDTTSGLTSLIDYLFKHNEFYTIQTNCPHLLRYLVSAVIINKSRKNYLNETIKLLGAEETYSDPITKFLSAICRDYDFAQCQSLLQECEEVVSTDFFLEQFRDQFRDGARLLVFEYYCRIHKCVQLDTLAKVLFSEEKLSEEEVEQRIVDLIRDSGINARVDSEKRQLEVNNKAQVRTSVYQQVIDKAKTKSIDFRTGTLIKEIEKKQEQRGGD